MQAIYKFDDFKWLKFQEFLSSLWSADRRRVLHLEKQNAFFFFVDCFIDWSERLLWLSWIPLLVAFCGGIETGMLGCVILGLTFFIRSVSLRAFSVARVKRFSMPLDYDGYGSFGRSRLDLKAFGRTQSVVMWLSILVSLVFLSLFIWSHVSN